VIATGFQRENLPAIERKGSRAAEPPVYVESAPPMHHSEPEPVYVETAPPAPEPVYEEQPKTLAAAAHGIDSLFDDLDVPAILRRDRRHLQ